MARPFNLLVGLDSLQLDGPWAGNSGAGTSAGDATPRRHSIAKNSEPAGLADSQDRHRAELQRWLASLRAAGRSAAPSEALPEAHLAAWLATLSPQSFAAADVPVVSGLLDALADEVRSLLAAATAPVSCAVGSKGNEASVASSTPVAGQAGLAGGTERLKRAVFYTCHILQAADAGLSGAAASTAAADNAPTSSSKRKQPGDRQRTAPASGVASSVNLCMLWQRARSQGLAAIAGVFCALRTAPHAILPQHVDKAAFDRLAHGCVMQLLAGLKQNGTAAASGSGSAAGSFTSPLHSAAVQLQLSRDAAAAVAQRLLLSALSGSRGGVGGNGSASQQWWELLAAAQARGDTMQKVGAS